MKTILVIVLIVLVAWLVFVKLPEAKCAGIARIGEADYYSFSAMRGCELRKGKMTWLMTPGFLRTYQPTEQMWIWEP